jgi:hypothetical protein
MKREVLCSGDTCMMSTATFDDDNPESLASHVLCNECRGEYEANERRLRLIADLASGVIEDRDLDAVGRLLDHLFGRHTDKALTAAGFYSLTPAKRKKLRRQIDEDFGPRIPEPI